ncbi:hypothetical protein SAMN00777080_0292 [Aquiflexum balticum DSM 16537]|uniref:Uncharacterized protein n=1 Tax=Aquiflexum balticum DSM 16537 TaxID=758820 RepID=A0A1W2GYS3_9BACT|nr:hypothetical protein [Aquiflexum balticum]SMD41761.1 hypothetical protein SAMN00777080_0292 [Aquiflexum balticum DSM 16537]
MEKIITLQLDKKQDKLFLFEHEIQNPYIEIQEELNEKFPFNTQNSSKTFFLEFYDFLCEKISGKRHPLLDNIDYCLYYSYPYQGIRWTTLKDEFEKHIEKFKKAVVENNVEEIQEYNKLHFGFDRNRFDFFAFNDSLESVKIKFKDSIVAYSHNYVGFTEILFIVDENFKFYIDSNLGFGKSSYFFLKVNYKGVQIVPFSKWIYFRYEKTSIIKKYTVEYPLARSSWTRCFNYIIESYQLYKTNESLFINKYMVGELDEMLRQVKEVFSSDNEIKTSYWDEEQTEHLEEVITIYEEILFYQGHKIVGCLDFVGSILVLSEFSVEVSFYIEKIEEYVVKVKKKIELHLIILKKRIIELQIEKENLKINSIEILSWEKSFQGLLKEKHNVLSYHSDYLSFLPQFLENNFESEKQLCIELLSFHEEMEKLTDSISNTENFVRRFSGIIEDINTYFDGD